jgi:uncharacterized protein (DUF433 family)
MARRKLVMAGIVSGSIALGGLMGATVFAPGVGFAATDTETGDEVVAVCAGVLGANVISTSADAIGIETSELLEALRGGQTIAEVAEDNGVDPATVVDALVAAGQDRLDQAVQDGFLTQDEADERAADLEQNATDVVNGDLPLPFHRPPLFGHPGLWGFADGPFAAAANAIGIGPVELVELLRDGQTIAEVAEDNDVEVSTVVDAVVEALKERLDSAVENGWITQEQADERAADLEEDATSLVNGDFDPFPFPGPFGHGPMPFDTDGAGSSTAVASQV